MPRSTDTLAVRLSRTEGSAVRRLAAVQDRPYGSLLQEAVRRYLRELSEAVI